jgi:SPP1 gp7 family putative phage head morphogenesis protein
MAKKEAEKVKKGKGQTANKDLLTSLMKSAKRDYSKFSDFMSEKENPNAVLKKTQDGQRKGLELFQEMLYDPQIGPDVEIRQKKVSSFPWGIIVPGGDDNDNEQVQLLEGQIKPVYGELLGEILDSEPFGFSITELMWVYQDGRLELPAVLGHDQKEFYFTEQWELMMKSESNEDSKVPMARVVLATFNKRKGNLYGNSLLTAAFWPWYFKKHGWLFWSTYLEKFGMPTVVGKFPEGTDDDQQDKLLECCQAIQSDMAVTVPEKWIIELLEAARSGNADTYEKFLRYCDKAISKVILLSVLGSNEAEFGTKAHATVHMDLTDQVIESDARWAARILTEQVIKPLAEWNYNFSVPPELVIQYTSEDTGKAMAERDKTLSDIVPVAIEDIHGKYNLTTPDEETIVTYRGWVGPYGKLLEKMQSQALPGGNIPPGLPGAPGEESEFSEPFGFGEGDIDKIDQFLLWENDFIAGLYDGNKKAIEDTIDFKQLKKLLGKADDYGQALLQLQKYSTNSGKLWEKFFIIARLLAEYSVREQIKQAEAEDSLSREFAEGTTTVPTRGMVQLEPGADFFYGDPDKAIKWFRQKVPVSRQVWKQLSDDARSAAFTLSKLNDLRMVNIAQEFMLDALTEGQNFQTFLKNLTFEFPGLNVARSYLHTSFLTNMASALSIQNEHGLMRVTGSFPNHRYSAVMDGRTRDSHASMHGFVARHDDPVWYTWTPPNGHHCRCKKTVCPNSKVEANQAKWRAKGINLDTIAPDEGFNLNLAKTSHDALINDLLNSLKTNNLNLNSKIRGKSQK